MKMTLFYIFRGGEMPFFLLKNSNEPLRTKYIYDIFNALNYIYFFAAIYGERIAVFNLFLMKD